MLADLSLLFMRLLVAAVFVDQSRRAAALRGSSRNSLLSLLKTKK